MSTKSIRLIIIIRLIELQTYSCMFTSTKNRRCVYVDLQLRKAFISNMHDFVSVAVQPGYVVVNVSRAQLVG